VTRRPPLDEPQPGFLIRYSYLWRDEARRGQEEGRKDRPCAVVLTTRLDGEHLSVYVLPVTHSAPARFSDAIEIPPATKHRLGLDDVPSWVVTNELNVFTWPGLDIRNVGNMDGSRRYAYGILPRAMTLDLIEAVREHRRSSRLRAVNRDPKAD